MRPAIQPAAIQPAATQPAAQNAKPRGSDADRANRLRWIACFMVVTWFAKVLIEMVWEYRFYFPADFGSSFLMGKKAVFSGLYRIAFYSHIVCGPITVVTGAYLMFSGGRGRQIRLHRLLGRMQMLIVVLVIVPSGLVMATQAYTGMIAVLGFALQGIGTGACAIAAVWTVMKGRVGEHKRWASRCFLFLCSPLILRIVSGGTIVLQIDTSFTYQLTAWGSWLVPIAVQEFYWVYRNRQMHLAETIATTLTTEGSR